MDEADVRFAIEEAIYIRDKRCETLEEKDALATLINFAEKIINELKGD